MIKTESVTSVSNDVLWCGEHMGAYIFHPQNSIDFELSLYRTFWSPKGFGATAFLRYSKQTGGSKVGLVLTDNRRLTEFMQSEIIPYGKPANNIANTLKEPIKDARFESSNRAKSRSERFAFPGNEWIVEWDDLSHPMLPGPHENTGLVKYIFAAANARHIRCYKNNDKFIDVKLDPCQLAPHNMRSQAFIGFCEIWYTGAFRSLRMKNH